MTKMCVGRVGDFSTNSISVHHYRQVRIALFRHGTAFFAVKDRCPHAGDAFSRGRVEGEQVVCPGHSWMFDLRTGQCLRGDTSCRIRTFRVTVEDDRVWIHLDD
ncbi:MAG: Rieske 2Fe-2S domain-containing protein [Deltaproteobacteria bacterium]|nr:Rieske 2Fe-2S domain-containing protein [Deltaproteobacteria bacterium]